MKAQGHLFLTLYKEIKKNEIDSYGNICCTFIKNNPANEIPSVIKPNQGQYNVFSQGQDGTP
jgi:hypothetical protein